MIRRQLCKDPGVGKSKVLEEGMGWQVHKCYGVVQAEGSETSLSWFHLSSAGYNCIRLGMLLNLSKLYFFSLENGKCQSSCHRHFHEIKQVKYLTVCHSSFSIISSTCFYWYYSPGVILQTHCWVPSAAVTQSSNLGKCFPLQAMTLELIEDIYVGEKLFTTTSHMVLVR